MTLKQAGYVSKYYDGMGLRHVVHIMMEWVLDT